jgi:hypothetical protein
MERRAHHGSVIDEIARIINLGATDVPLATPREENVR